MSKFVNVTVSTSLSADFYLEVPDDATEDQIKEIASKEVILPHTYPNILDNFLKTKMGIKVQGLDSMLKSWNIDEVEYNYDYDKREKDSNPWILEGFDDLNDW